MYTYAIVTKCGSIRRVNAARKDGAEKALQKMAKKTTKNSGVDTFRNMNCAAASLHACIAGHSCYCTALVLIKSSTLRMINNVNTK